MVHAQVDQCVNNWTPLAFGGDEGELFKDLYSVHGDYDKYTRVVNVCIWQDTSLVNGPALRINGLHFSTVDLADTAVPRTVTQ